MNCVRVRTRASLCELRYTVPHVSTSIKYRVSGQVNVVLSSSHYKTPVSTRWVERLNYIWHARIALYNDRYIFLPNLDGGHFVSSSVDYRCFSSSWSFLIPIKIRNFVWICFYMIIHFLKSLYILKKNLWIIIFIHILLRIV